MRQTRYVVYVHLDDDGERDEYQWCTTLERASRAAARLAYRLERPTSVDRVEVEISRQGVEVMDSDADLIGYRLADEVTP